MLRDIIYTLDRLGLKSSDAHVFLACLRRKDGAFAQDVARDSKVKRSTVDLILSRLMEEGFLTRLKVGNRYKYFAQEPEKILFQKEQVLADFRDLIPVLNRLGGDMPASDIRFFEGVDGVRQLYSDAMLRLKMAEPAEREVLSLSSGVDVLRLLPDLDKFWVKKRIALRAPVRIIAPETARVESTYVTNPQRLREVKYFDAKKFPFHICIETFANDMLAIYSPLKPINGVLIRNARMALSVKSAFNLLWSFLD